MLFLSVHIDPLSGYSRVGGWEICLSDPYKVCLGTLFQQGMIDQPLARLAQSVERETLKEFLRNLKVVGSTPTSGSIPVVPISFCLFGDCFAHFKSPWDFSLFVLPILFLFLRHVVCYFLVLRSLFPNSQQV